MWRLLDPRRELGLVSPEIAEKLVETLYPQITTVIISGSIFVVLGLIEFASTNAPWYLVAAVVSGLVGLGRVQLAKNYARRRASATTLQWAVRCMCGAWATGALWGAWTIVLLFEPRAPLMVIVIGVHSTCVIGGALRHSAVIAAAAGQVFLAMVPLCVVCAISGDLYLDIFAVFSAWHLYAALIMTQSQRRKILRMLLADEEQSRLVARLQNAQHELELANRHLETLAASDALTGVANRRAFDLAAEREWHRAAREQLPLSLLLLDVDEFKAYNDRNGHTAGDACLRDLAAEMGGLLRRPGDILARYGGEEFAMILPATYLEGAVLVAEQIRQGIEQRRMPHTASPLGLVSVSIGAACLIPGPDVTLQYLKELADAALYSAKRGGRNRVHAARPECSLVS